MGLTEIITIYNSVISDQLIIVFVDHKYELHRFSSSQSHEPSHQSTSDNTFVAHVDDNNSMIIVIIDAKYAILTY